MLRKSMTVALIAAALLVVAQPLFASVVAFPRPAGYVADTRYPYDIKHYTVQYLLRGPVQEWRSYQVCFTQEQVNRAYAALRGYEVRTFHSATTLQYWMYPAGGDFRSGRWLPDRITNHPNPFQAPPRPPRDHGNRIPAGTRSDESYYEFTGPFNGRPNDFAIGLIFNLNAGRPQLKDGFVQVEGGFQQGDIALSANTPGAFTGRLDMLRFEGRVHNVDFRSNQIQVQFRWGNGSWETLTLSRRR